VKQYAKIGKDIVDAYSQYVAEVRNGQFPTK
jgi:ketopantoate hydroxymethyltransferase